MTKFNQLYNQEKILFVIKCIRNGALCNESLSEYTVVSGQSIFAHLLGRESINECLIFSVKING